MKASNPPLAPKSKAEQELESFDTVFDALAHRSRRHILVVLDARGGTMTSGEIAQRFSCSWPTTTRHLRVLEAAGLVEVTRQGRESLYRLNTARLTSVVGGWLSWFSTSDT